MPQQGKHVGVPEGWEVVEDTTPAPTSARASGLPEGWEVVEEQEPKSVLGFLGNAAESGYNLAKGTVTGTYNLLKNTLEFQANPAKWAAEVAANPGVQAAIANPSAVAKGAKDYFGKRYGGLEAIGNTAYTDPFGLAADVATVATLGGGAAARAPGVVGRVGRGMAALGSVVDPMANVGRLGGVVAPYAGKVAERVGEGLNASALGVSRSLAKRNPNVNIPRAMAEEGIVMSRSGRAKLDNAIALDDAGIDRVVGASTKTIDPNDITQPLRDLAEERRGLMPGASLTDEAATVDAKVQQILKANKDRIGQVAPPVEPEMRRTSINGVVTEQPQARNRAYVDAFPSHPPDAPPGASVYRGMTPDEYASVRDTGQIKSTGAYSHSSEGTSFGKDFGTSEGYVNYGRDNPAVTGRDTYVIKVKHGPDIVVDPRDGYPKAAAAIPADRIEGVYIFKPDGSVHATGAGIPLAEAQRTKVALNARLAKTFGAAPDSALATEMLHAERKGLMHAIEGAEPEIADINKRLGRRYAVGEAMDQAAARPSAITPMDLLRGGTGSAIGGLVGGGVPGAIVGGAASMAMKSPYLKSLAARELFRASRNGARGAATFEASGPMLTRLAVLAQLAEVGKGDPNAR